VTTRPKVLITGAAGRIGSFITPRLAERYDLALTDLRAPDETHGLPFVAADIADAQAIAPLFGGVDTVVHLAADPRVHADWDSLMPRNIVGVQNVFAAAHAAGCRRVVFASSINAVSGYPRDMQVHTSMPVRPPNLYGATKAWGEALACYYADQLGLSAICLRFGWVIARDSEQLRANPKFLDRMLTYDDLTRLVQASIAAPDTLRFGIYHGLSNNRWKWLDINDARIELGYAPEDDAFDLAGVIERDAT